jgi:choline kinase
MIGIVLAAGAGRRLLDLTTALPKTLLPLSEDRTILDSILENLKAAGMDEVTLVTGFAADQIERRLPDLERRHGLRLTTIYNERAEEWNNAYSLWLAREAFRGGALLVNGDTVHPPSVESALLAARAPGVELLLAVDDHKPLGAEEMKVLLGEDGTMRRINKALDPSSAQGEYIGVTLIEAAAAARLAAALEATWRRDPSLYYEDGFQELVDRGGRVHTASIGAVDWAEVDDETDLGRAREIECRS